MEQLSNCENDVITLHVPDQAANTAVCQVS